MRFILFLACFLATSAFAADTKGKSNVDLDQSRLYVGGGLNFNSVGVAGNASGFQFFAGYEHDARINNDIKIALEVGYMDSGNFNTFGFGNAGSAEGVWIAVPFEVAIDRRLDVLTRIGADFGDDDGLLVGAGVGYNFNKKSALRVEYVVRDTINSFQFNVLVRL